MDETDMSLRIITKGALIILIGTLFSKLLTYIYRIILARYLGPTPYGLISIGFSVVGIFGLIAALGIPEGMLRYIPFYKGKKDTKKINAVIAFGLKLTFFISILLGLLLFFTSNFISLKIFHNVNLIPILKLFSIVVPIVILCYNFEVIIQAFQSVKYIFYSRHIGESLSRLILTIGFLLIGLKLIGAAIAYIIAMALGVLLMIYFVHTKIYKIPNLFKKYPPIKKEFLFFSLPLMFSNLFIFFFIWTDTILLGYFTNANIVGIYNAAVPSARLIYILPTALLMLYTPTLIENYAKLKEIPKLLYKTVTKWIFLVNLPILLLLTFFSKQFLNIFFGNVYTEGYKALSILLFGYFFYSLTYTTENNLLAFKKSKLIMTNKIISGTLNIVLNIILIPKYGMNGAACATSIALFTESLIVNIESFYLTKIIPFKYSYIKLILSALISIIIVKQIFGYFFDLTNIYILIISILLFSIIYLVLLLITKFFEREDMRVISLIQRKLGLNLRFINKIIRKFK